MKRIYQLLSGLFLMLFFIGCKKDNYAELYKGDNPLNLSASKMEILLNQADIAGDALIYNWTTGTNKGTDAAISYQLKIDRAGNNFSTAVTEDMGSDLTKKYTTGVLNDLLLTKWGIEPGTAVSLEARVIATVSNEAVSGDSSAIIAVSITPYKPVTSALFLIGDATPNGWSADAATPLTAGSPGQFTWSGNLKSGELKFITTPGQFLPSYNKGEDETMLLYRTADNQPDDKFIINSPGPYNITVNLIDLTVSVIPSTTPPYTRLWMLGDATPTGWNIDTPSEMRVDSSNLFVFTYNEILKAGEFKIPVATGNFGTDYYMPLAGNQPLTETGVQLVPGGSPDYKWKVANPGPYKISLDLQTMKISIKPFTPYTAIWMVGDASPVGWNIDNPHPMTADPSNPYIFSYTGPMAVGEFKFPLGKGNWGGDYFMPVINGAGPGSTQMKFVAAGNPDNKWKITQAGNYKITINQLYETISIIKQ
jgi:hypothetical protein